MRSRFTLLLLATSLACSVVAPSHSQAAVAFYKNSSKVTGGVLVGVGAAVGGTGALMTSVAGSASVGAVEAFVLAVTGVSAMASAAIVATIGIIVLDAEEGVSLQYQPISDQETGVEIGLTIEEIDAFNANVDLFNAVQEDIAYESQFIHDFDERIAGEMWMTALTTLGVSLAAQQALVKVTGSAVQAGSN